MSKGIYFFPQPVLIERLFKKKKKNLWFAFAKSCGRKLYRTNYNFKGLRSGVSWDIVFFLIPADQCYITLMSSLGISLTIILA